MENQLIKYYEQLNIDKKNAEKNLLIDNRYLIHECLNACKLRFSSVIENDRYGFINVIFKIITTINITNEKIIQSNTLYNSIKRNSNEVLLYNTYIYAKYHNLNESIVHDIKGFCDKLITIVFLEQEPELVNDLKIASVGKYLNEDNKNRILKNQEDFLNKINELDNSYKHSFSNTMDPDRIGLYDNCIVNYYSKNGKNIFKPKVISIKLDDIVDGFNKFMDEVEKILEVN